MQPGLPLAGLTVVELCHSIAGPYVGFVLGGLGAKVIKIERPEDGDDARHWGPPDWHGASALFQAFNREKQSVEINLRSEDQRIALRDFIIEHADIFVQNLRPAALAGSELCSEELLRLKPSLIYCNLGAFGNSGPFAFSPGYDPLMQARAGIMSVTGEEGRAPVRVGSSIVDMGAGLWAVIGILAATYQRVQNGLGCVVDTSLFETAISWMTVHIAGFLASGEERRRMGSATVEIVPHQAFATADGHIMIAAGNDKLFQKLCAALGRSDLITDERFHSNPQRVRHRALLIPDLALETSKHETRKLIALLEAAGVPCSPLQSISQVVSDEQVRALGILQSAPDKAMTLVGLPLSFDGARPAYRNSAPALGEHNHLILTTAKATGHAS